MTKSEREKALGRPTKVAGGMSSVIFVRAPADLKEKIDAYIEEERAKQTRGASRITQGDAVRELLYKALELR